MSGSNTGPGANPVPQAAQADFADRLKFMQPRGRIWDNPVGSVMSLVREAQAALMAQFNARLAELTETESYPPTSEQLLAVWEQAFGLPDPCTPLEPTIAQRQQAIAARLAQNGNLSIPSIIAIAAALGYTITITKYHAATVDTLVADEPCYDPDWASVWQINAPDFTIEYLSADTGHADDPLASWGNTQLTCVMNRIAPPDKILIYNFGG